MKLTTDQAVFAILEISLEMEANQRAMNHLLLNSLSLGDEKKLSEMMAYLNTQVNTELGLIRARLFRHGDLNIDDLLNGEFEV